MSEISNLSIRVIAPSFKISEAELLKCLKGLEKLNISVQIQKPLFREDQLCAHTTTKRFRDLNLALIKPSDYVWCLRGGYGALHLVPDLMKMKPPKQVSKLIGFSDITVLHYFFNQMWQWPTLHWKHLNGFLQDGKKFLTQDLKQSLKMLSSEDYFIFDSLKPFNPAARDLKTLRSKVIGGNLITLQSMVGLKIKKPKSCLLFLEEIDEPVYKIDRALTQLEQNGWFKNIDGILLGSFTNRHEATEQALQIYLKDKFKNFNIPVFGHLKAGHISNQQPLFLNTSAEIFKIKKKFSLKVANGFKTS